MTVDLFHSVEPQLETDMIPAVILMILFRSTDLQAQSVSPPAEYSVRLVDGTTSCSGKVEVFYRGEWLGLCPSWWSIMKEAKVLCRELNCGNPVAESIGPLVEDGRKRGLFLYSCRGNESLFRQCDIRGEPGYCFGEYYHHVICSESVWLVDGAGLCSGRVEVKSSQSWASVCEADFDRQDAEVVCRDIGCGAPAALQGGLYGEGEGQTWDKEFQCKGKESLLLDCDTSDRKHNTCLPGNAVGLTCSEPDNVRLVGGGSRCAGGVEWYDQGEWRTVGTLSDVKAMAAVVCRQLGCGSTLSVLPGDTTRRFGVSCSGSESSLRECLTSYDLLPGLTVICSDLLVQPDISLTDSLGGVSRDHNFTITCSTQPQYPGGSFLLTFTGSNIQQIQPAVNHSAAFHFPAADDSHQGNYSCVYDNYVFSHNFSSESELLSLAITDLQVQSVSPPAEYSVRLVNGTTSCSGTVEVFYRGEWLGLCPVWWSMRDVKVLCRELNCGNPVSESIGPLIEDGRRGVFLYSCRGNESLFRQCDIRGRPGVCNGGYYHHVTCSESVKLVDGAGLCSGRVEVKSNQSWASVCEADFDRQDAEVVCRDVGCGAPAALQGGLYGEGGGQTWDKEFQCKGNESLLLDCDTSDRENNTCLPGNAVGLTCSEPDDVRLVGGGCRCAGGVEWYDQGEWRTVGTLSDVKAIAAVVCRQLDCGSTVSALTGNITRGFGVSCSGSESSLRECSRSYDLLPGLTVICSDLLVQPDIFLTDSMGGVFRGHQGPEVFRGYSFTITCSTQPQYPGGSFLLTFTDSNRTQTQPAVNHSAAFLFPAADDSHQGNYSCVYDNDVFSHNFSSESELLSLTITDLQAQSVSPPAELSVRLVNGTTSCSGKVEVFYRGEWLGLCPSWWSIMKETKVLCRELNCGNPVAESRGPLIEDGRGGGLFLYSCRGNESLFRQCEIRGEPGVCDGGYYHHVTCSESVRLVDGAGLCSGRVEVKSNQSWASVCEADFDRQDAEVVCGELGCGAPAALQGGLYGEGEGQTWDKEFQCKGKESLLLDCDTSDRENNTCLPGNAVGLTCSEPDDVRLVGGGSRCAGGVEWYDQGEWRTVGNLSDVKAIAALVCRQLGCGSTVSVPPGNITRGFGVSCSGSESSLRECSRSYDLLPGLTVICSESVRLVDGASLCSGRVEVKSNQSWVSVCEADFDRQDAEVVCGELGCGAPAALQGGLYGEGGGQTWDKEFQCKGNESLLLDCDTSDRENNTCLPGNAVGLTCSKPDDVRLVGGGSHCAGGVEWYDQGEWRTVGADDWNQRDVAAVVCRQLGCGSTVSVPPGNTTRGFSVSCSGSEGALRECSRSYDLLPGLTVICSDLLVQPDIFLTDLMGGVFRGHQGPEMFRGYNFTITCSTQPQYPGGSFLLTFTGSNRTQTQPAVNHSAAFLFPAADDSHQGNYSCVYDNYVFSHNFSSESELLSLTITASPLPAFIIRHVVVLLILLTAITTSYLYYKPTRRQKRVNRVSSMDLYVNAMEMVSLSSRAEAGPGEERAAQGTE
ncbi:deleted in malignant brain tumors 1 protein-like isoform X4 [Oncorhynchus nerka]|uniref:deleted in malignant brain tumors 1 protein-like isoform X4 n=1 Tax=Oncorhynchus nerka TaxID=8023 RepID=UPI0031B81029